MKPDPKIIAGALATNEAVRNGVDAAVGKFALEQGGITYQDFAEGYVQGRYLVAFFFDGKRAMSRVQLKAYTSLVSLYMVVPMLVLPGVAIETGFWPILFAYPACLLGAFRRVRLYPRRLPELWLFYLGAMALGWHALGSYEPVSEVLLAVVGGYVWGAAVCWAVERYEFGTSLLYATSDEARFNELRDSGAMIIRDKQAPPTDWSTVST